MNPFAWAMRWWRRRQRAIDEEILWEACLIAADQNRALAKTAFAAHMELDTAYAGLSANDKRQILENLP